MSTPQAEASEHLSSSSKNTASSETTTRLPASDMQDGFFPKIGLWEHMPDGKEARSTVSSVSHEHVPASIRSKREKIGYSSERNRAFEILTQPRMIIPVMALSVLMISYLWLSSGSTSPTVGHEVSTITPTSAITHAPQTLYPEAAPQIAPVPPTPPTVALTPEQRQELLRHLQGE